MKVDNWLKIIRPTQCYSEVAAGLESENIFENTSSENSSEAFNDIEDELNTQVNSELEGGEPDGFEEDPYVDGTNYQEWDDVENEDREEAERKPEDCVNLFEIISQYMNNYRKLCSNFYTNKLIEETGDFNKHPNAEQYRKMFEAITLVMDSTKSKTYKNLSAVKEILQNSTKMEKVCGEKKAPFIYEGIQLAFITQLHNVYLLLPYIFKHKTDFEKTSQLMGMDKQINFFDEVMEAIIKIEPALGDKITFQESSKSEITGRSNEIADTPYNDSEILTDGMDEIDTVVEPAGESIMNLIAIKANNAILEFNLIMREFSLMVTYLDTFKPLENFKIITTNVTKILVDENTDKLQEKAVEVCNALSPVLLDANRAYKKILKDY